MTRLVSAYVSPPATVRRFGVGTHLCRWVVTCERCGWRSRVAERLSLAMAAFDDHEGMHALRFAEARADRRRSA